MKSLDAIALGTCYVDTNLPDYPFGKTGIPAETELIGEHYETVAGGSAVNFCRLLGNLGLKTAFIGMAGTDANGDALEALLQKDGVEPLLIRHPGLLTNIGFNMTSPDGDHIMLIAGTANAALNPESVLPHLERVIGEATTLYLGGCFKLKLLAPTYPQMVETAKRHGVLTVVDHGRVPDSTDPVILEAVRQLVLLADYYLPSRDEFCKLWNVGTIGQGLAALGQKAPGVKAIVKDGANGAYYWEGSLRHVPAPKVGKVIHATGAGDSFNAGVITAIKQELSINDAVAHGCAVAAAKIAGEPIPALP